MEVSNLCNMEISNVVLIVFFINFSRKDFLSGCRYISKKLLFFINLRFFIYFIDLN